MEIGLLLSGIMLIIIATIAVIGLILFIVGITRQKKKNGLTISGAIVGGVFGLLYLTLNPTGPSEITNEIEGTYKFTYPKGQVEVLSIKNNHTFSQAIYSDEKDFFNSKTRHNNNGTWTTSGEQLQFDHWLSICDMGRDIDSILPQPEISTMMNVYWHEATSENKGQIDIYFENGYVFEKIGK